MDRKIIVHQFNPEIYPRKLWIVVNATKEVLDDHFEFESPLDETWINDCDATLSLCRYRTSHLLGAVIYTKHSKFKPSFAAHEAVHFGDYIWEIIGESTRTDECFAYLVGWVVRCIEEVNNYNSSSSLDERTPELIELISQDEYIGVNIDTKS